MNMAEYGSQQSEKPQNVKFEPIIRGFRNDIFDRDQKNEKRAIRGGAGWLRRLMARVMENSSLFCVDPSL